jgi:squalene synthase HpnC
MAAVASADKEARRLLRSHYENFWVSSILVPRALRPHLARIYAFCRRTDDLGDEHDGDAESGLQAWREDVLRCFDASARPVDTGLLALADTIRIYHLPREPFLDLIDANLRDQRTSRYQDYTQLFEYCRFSAAPVGRLVLRLYGFRDRRLDRLSDDVCIGLQLANFAQDVSIDRQKGRVYLVQSDLQRLGIAGAVRSMCREAARLLHSGLELEASVPYRLRVQLSLYRRGGEAILAAITHIGYRTDQCRPRVSNAAKAGLLVSGIVGSLGRHANAHQYRAA